MKFSQILLLCYALLATALCTPQKHKASDGREYLIETEYKYNWFQAFHECARRDSQLVIIDSADKNTAIINLLKKVVGKSHNLWLGGNDDFSSSHDYNRPFYWSATGKLFTFSFWSASNPDNYNGQEHCVHIWANKPLYQWNDVDCINKMGFICEENHFLEMCKKKQEIECEPVKKFNNDISTKIEHKQNEHFAQLFSKLQNIENLEKNGQMEIQNLLNLAQSAIQNMLANQEVTAKGLSDKILKQVKDFNDKLKSSVELINTNLNEKLNASLPLNFKNVVLIRQGV